MAARPKVKKPSFIARMKNRGRETVSLGRTLKDEPRAFPGQLLRVLKRSFHTVWNARGGGLYACGFVITFIWLEIRTVIAEFAAAEGIGTFLTGQLFEILIRVTVQSIQNTVMAFLWPVWVIERFEYFGIAALVVLYFLFPRLIKEPLNRWLFDDGDAPAAAPVVAKKQAPGEE
ncbi:MAG: hypothetical protein WEA08_02815 [Woeseia sp.]